MSRTLQSALAATPRGRIALHLAAWLAGRQIWSRALAGIRRELWAMI